MILWCSVNNTDAQLCSAVGLIIQDRMVSHKDRMGSYKDRMGPYKDRMGSHKDSMVSHKDRMRSNKDRMGSHNDSAHFLAPSLTLSSDLNFPSKVESMNFWTVRIGNHSHKENITI